MVRSQTSMKKPADHVEWPAMADNIPNIPERVVSAHRSHQASPEVRSFLDLLAILLADAVLREHRHVEEDTSDQGNVDGQPTKN